MLEHAEAKVSLYSICLAKYLNLLGRVSSVKRIFLFDLICSEGINDNGGKGSPVVAAEVSNNHYFTNNQSCPNLLFLSLSLIFFLGRRPG